MNRQDFVTALEITEPALADNILMPILAHFWFKDDTVIAFNDQIAIETPLQTGYNCALPGQMLLRLLKASRAKQLELTKGQDEITIKAARAKFRLPALPEETFLELFNMPKWTGKSIKVERLLPSMQRLLRSVAKEASILERAGMTFIFDAAGVSIYSTNDYTLSHARLSLGDRPLELYNTDRLRLTLPASFCKELIKLSKNSKSAAMIFAKDHAVAMIGETMLFTRLLAVEGHAIDYDKIMSDNLPKKLMLAKRPTNLSLVVDRAAVIAEAYDSDLYTEISVSEGKMRFYTTSPYGDAVDVLDTEQENALIKVHPKHLKDIDQFDYMNVTKECVIFSDFDKKNIYLVGAANERPSK